MCPKSAQTGSWETVGDALRTMCPPGGGYAAFPAAPEVGPDSELVRSPATVVQ